MKVRFKRGWWRTYATLTPGNVYRVIERVIDRLRLIDDLGEPLLFSVYAFEFVDATQPDDWVTEYGDEGECYESPAEFAKPGFFEDWHDGDRAAQSKLRAYLRGICWHEAEAAEDNGNTYLRVRWKHEDSDFPVILYSELDEERWEVRKVDVFLDGRMTYADGRGSSGDTQLGEVPCPTLEEIAAADPEFEPVTISRDDFEHVWAQAMSADAES